MQDQTNLWVRRTVLLAATAALLLAMDTLRLFGGEQWLGELVRVDTQFYFALLGLLLPCAFLLYKRSFWIDIPLALLAAGASVAFFVTAETALDEAWEFGAPVWAQWVAVIFWILLARPCVGLADWRSPSLP